MANFLFDGLLGGRETDPATLLRIPGSADWSYADTVAASGRLANLLLDAGVQPGDRVMVQVPKSAQAIALYLAAVRAGAVFLPLNTAYTRAEVEYFLDDAEPALFVCGGERAGDYDDTAVRRFTLDADGGGSLMPAAAVQAAEFANVERAPEDLGAILYTSGTTGLSKGAMLSHDNLLSNALVLVDYWHFDADDVLLHALPIFHTHGLFVATNVILICGGSMIFLPRFDVDAMIEQLPRATTLMGVPTFYTRLLADDRFTRELVAHMRLFVSGSAPLLEQTFEEFRERTGHTILERYGMTETGMNTSNPLSGERKPGTVGPPLPGVQLRIVDEEDVPLARGAVGHIQLKGPNVFRGYWRMPEKTAEDFTTDGWFRSGDLGRIDDGGYVAIVGRHKDLVISGGYNVYPKEVELRVDEVEGVKESAVIGLPHPDFGEAVAAVVVCEAGRAVSEADVIGFLRDELANYKVPKRVLFVDELPRNAMGKVQKNLLRETFS